MPKVFFNKKILSNSFIVGGRAVPFEGIGDNQGVLALDDADPNHKDLIAALTEAARQGRGGIILISEQQYADLKKKLPLTPSGNKSNARRNQILQVAQQPPKKPQAPPANRAENKPYVPTKAEWVKAGYPEANYESAAERIRNGTWDKPTGEGEFPQQKMQESQTADTDEKETPKEGKTFRPKTEKKTPDDELPQKSLMDI